MTFEAKIIEDSIVNGSRITTMQLKYPRFIHSQFLTHRMFSRNSSSSRAIPVNRIIEEIKNDPVKPLEWGKNNPGMSSKTLMDEQDAKKAEEVWMASLNSALEFAKQLGDLQTHKQLVNRILEPYQHIHTIVTATEFENFFNLRIDDEAQPEIQKLAQVMKAALDYSTPVNRETHLPYVDEEERKLDAYTVGMISAARCARVSYLNHDGSKPNLEKDLELAERLLKHQHMSPFEHQAIYKVGNHYNLRNWLSQRYHLELSRGEV